MRNALAAITMAALLGGCGAEQPTAEERTSADTGLSKRQRRASVYLRADANGDRVVTRAEIEREASDRFARLDRNRDGTFSAEEIAATPGYARSSERGQNRRGPITREEHMARALRRFDRRDDDGDGRLSGRELERITRRAKRPAAP